LAKFEADFRPVAEGELGVDDLLSLLRESEGALNLSRDEAIARYLAGGEDWKTALRHLNGAFAGKREG
jgi:hypothetical protein